MARKQRKAIISCAVTGAIHVPSLSPHLPITPEEIADQAVGAAEAGAAILHLHARDPATGRPTPDPDVFGQFLPEHLRPHRRGHQHHDRRRPGHVARGARSPPCAGSTPSCAP